MLSLWMTVALAGEHDVLLVGNSYTAANGLAEALETSLRADPQWVDAEVFAIAAPGLTLAEHAENAAIATTPWANAQQTAWGAVVLQEQSQIPGLGREHPAVVASEQAVAALLAHTVPDRALLFETWGRQDGDPANPERYADFAAMQGHLTEGYAALAASQGARVAPVGQAFAALRASSPEGVFPQLYRPDGSHPSAAGTYLAATVLHGVLTGRLEGDRSAVLPEVTDPARTEADAAVRRVVDLQEPEPEPVGCRVGPASGASWAWCLALVGMRRRHG